MAKLIDIGYLISGAAFIALAGYSLLQFFAELIEILAIQFNKPEWLLWISGALLFIVAALILYFWRGDSD